MSRKERRAFRLFLFLRNFLAGDVAGREAKKGSPAANFVFHIYTLRRVRRKYSRHYEFCGLT